MVMVCECSQQIANNTNYLLIFLENERSFYATSFRPEIVEEAPADDREKYVVATNSSDSYLAVHQSCYRIQ